MEEYQRTLKGNTREKQEKEKKRKKRKKKKKKKKNKRKKNKIFSLIEKKIIKIYESES